MIFILLPIEHLINMAIFNMDMSKAVEIHPSEMMAIWGGGYLANFLHSITFLILQNRQNIH